MDVRRAGQPVVVVLAGLPGSGKSALARELAERLGALLLDKDRVRAALFAPRHVSYTRAQDDQVVACLLHAAEHAFASGGARVAVLDGRTFTRRAQVEALRAWAAAHGVELRWIECVCDPALARARLAADVAHGAHPAANRTPELLARLAAQAEALCVERLVLATDDEPPAALARRALAWLEEPR